MHGVVPSKRFTSKIDTDDDFVRENCYYSVNGKIRKIQKPQVLDLLQKN